MHLVDGREVAFVAIVERGAERLSRAQQRVVDCPRVDTDAPNVRLLVQCRAQPGKDRAVQLVDVPVQPVRGLNRSVREPQHVVQPQLLGTDVTEHDAAAGRAEIDRRDYPRHYRRKAAATPASTGMCSPVVWLRSDVHSTKTAFATFSGSTSRLS